eukprot:TRINITY_DN123_c0_g1_i1.p1 TRINITY_DN123_c0_g1~~TRINITY_DN123_c0_g1_i1.p1  ORF type:complete len:245 (-),score=44.15 TRINITY_DN123_c0_g1_i1:126-860(-)
MKFSAVTVSAFAALLGVSSAYQAWVQAGVGDSRGPCPGLNTLANHGYLPHDGLNITRDDFVNALTEVYNLDSSFAGTLADGALNKLGKSDANGDLVISLSDLNEHNAIEHDASLTRQDYGDTGGDNHSPNADLIAELKGFSSDGTVLTWCDVATARSQRPEEEAASDSTFSFTDEQAAVAYGEAALILDIFGNGENVSLTNIDSFFAKEAIPSGWTPPASAFTESHALESAAYLKALEALDCYY